MNWRPAATIVSEQRIQPKVDPTSLCARLHADCVFITTDRDRPGQQRRIHEPAGGERTISERRQNCFRAHGM